MAAIYPNWASGNFTAGDKVTDDGVIYQALNTFASATRPTLDPTNWEAVGVVKIQSYHSLRQAIALEINTDDDMINDSIPLFIQMAEESFETRIRAPIQRATTILTVDTMSRVEIPRDLLQVINLRHNSTTPRQSDLLDRGRVEILAGNVEEYQELRQLYSDTSRSNSFNQVTGFEAPVYWYDEKYFYIAPDYEQGTEMELNYYASIPKLGTEVLLVNQNGDPINSAGQTVAQWVSAGNTANSFVQAMDTVERNWFVTSAPQMLLYGALINADLYLKDDSRTEIWHAKFERAELETQDKINRFESGRAHTIQIGNFYST